MMGADLSDLRALPTRPPDARSSRDATLRLLAGRRHGHMLHRCRLKRGHWWKDLLVISGRERQGRLAQHDFERAMGFVPLGDYGDAEALAPRVIGQ